MNLVISLFLIISFIVIIQNRRFRSDSETLCTVLLSSAVVITVVFCGCIAYRSNAKDFLDIAIQAISIVFGLLQGNNEDLLTQTANYPEFLLFVKLLSVIVPTLTAGTVFVFLARRMPRPVRPARTYHIFSQLDGNSILLARDIGRKEDACNTVFIFLRTTYEEQDADILQQLKGLRYQLFPYTESDLLRYHYFLRAKKLRFFFLANDTDRNFDQMDQLIRTVDQKHLFRKGLTSYFHKISPCEYRQEIYLLSETSSAPMLIDDLRRKLCEPGVKKRKKIFKHTELRLLDRYRAVSYHLLDKMPLYNARHDEQVRVLILGFGKIGQALFRSIASFQAMKDCKTTFCLCDLRIGQAYDALLQQYPLCADKLTVERRKIDAESKKLIAFLEERRIECRPFTYIVVALGDDERNIRTATLLKRYYRKLYWEYNSPWQPRICVNIEDTVKSHCTQNLFPTLEEHAKHRPWDAPMRVFGTNEETFSTEVLMPQGVWLAAERLHEALSQKVVRELGLWTEYERRSSIACVSHAAYHIATLQQLCDEYFGKEYAKRYPQNAGKLIDTEHQRWMDYVRSEGMQCASTQIVQAYFPKLNSHVDILGQFTPCIVPARELDSLYYDTLKPMCDWDDDKLSFRQRDELVVLNAERLYRIIRDQDSAITLIYPNQTPNGN